MQSTSSRSCKRVTLFWYHCLKKIVFLFINVTSIPNYYMQSKSERSDWFFLGRDFAIRIVSVEMVISCVFFVFEIRQIQNTTRTKLAEGPFGA